jgi:hypothetical protein
MLLPLRRPVASAESGGQGQNGARKHKRVLHAENQKKQACFVGSLR